MNNMNREELLSIIANYVRKHLIFLLQKITIMLQEKIPFPISEKVKYLIYVRRKLVFF